MKSSGPTGDFDLSYGVIEIKYKIRRLSICLSEQELDQMTRIAAFYYPNNFDARSMLLEHITWDACIHVAVQSDQIIGFSINSCDYRKTPFCKTEIPLIFQKILYIDPVFQKRGVGIKLQIAGLRYHVGLLWIFSRFTVICLTNNPLILRAFSQYDVYYPRQEASIPADIYDFCKQLAPAMGFESIDQRLLVYGTNESILDGADYTLLWKKFLFSGHDSYDQMILNRVFNTRDEKVFHRGTLQLAIGYARSMRFIWQFIKVQLKYPSFLGN
jgi:hypothetical protein